MVLGTLVTLPEVAQAEAPPKPPAPTCPDERADAASASVEARLCGKKVEVADARTETTQVWAKPEGGFTSQVYTGPVRFKQGDVWKPVDLALGESQDGSVAPVGHPYGLKLTGAVSAGEHIIASVGVDGDTLGMAWTGALPKPVLKENTATYAEVLPGVDLVLTATRTGFEQSFVAKDRAAAARVASVTLPLRSKGLKFVGDGPGSYAIRNASGKTLGRLPTPQMWDAQRGPEGQVTREKTLDAKARPALVAKGFAAKAGTDASGGTGTVLLDIDADKAWLDDPATVYPVTIDPAITISPIEDTFVRSDNDADRSGSDEIEIGKSTSYTAHGYVQWPMAQFAGANIKTARMYLWNWYSGNCSQNGWDAYMVQPFSIPLTWSTQPAIIAEGGYSTETKGYSTACDDNWIGMDVKQFVQYYANNRAPTGYMGLTAYNETTTNGWKQVRSLQAASSSQLPHIDVDYDAAPIISNMSTSPSTVGCATGTNRPWIASKTPTLQALVSDADTAALPVTFEWGIAGSSTNIGSQTVSGVPQNTSPSVTVPAGAFLEGGSYQWRVTSSDGVRNTVSPWCEFSVDTVKPGVPTVTSALYPSIATQNTWGHGGAGQAGTFTFTGTGTNPPLAGTTAVSSAACSPTESAPQAVDGSNTTKWCSGDTSKWLKVTLPTTQMVTQVVLRHAGAGGENVAWNTKDYDIQLSSDDVTYWTALQVRGNTASVTTHDLAAPGNAKYIKVNVLAPTSDANNVARIYEVEAYTGTRLSATATSPNATCAATETVDKAVDGNITTKWCSGDPAQKWAQLDLGSVQNVSNLVVRNASENGESSAFNTKDYDIQTSSDGTNWTTAMQVRGNTAGSVNSRFPSAVSARYLKLIVVTPTQTTENTVRIMEIQAYGTVEISDIVEYTYQLDNAVSATTIAAGNPTTVQITPTEEGRRTLTVRAKDRAGQLSDPNVYVFNVGRAGLKMPQPGANVIKRTKLAVDGDSTLTRAVFQYRRGPGATEYDIPLGNLHNADGSAVTVKPTPLASLGANGIWDAVDTLGTVGGVVQVRAVLYPAADGQPGINTQWITVSVDPDGDGAASDEVGPGSVNLLTGDYALSSSDADEFGMGVGRSASSRRPEDGWVPQGERLPTALQQITVSPPAVNTGGTSDATRATDRGQGSSTDSLMVVPKATMPGGGMGPTDTFVALGDDQGDLRYAMKPGKRYRATGWIYVPAATGLGTTDARALRLVGFYRDSAGNYQEFRSAKAAWVDGWQELKLDLAIPAGATEAFFRLYNGYGYGSSKAVYWDNLSLKEIVAPFGPQWRGGADGGVADVDYESLTFPSADVAKITNSGGDSFTFGRSVSGQFFPEPGAEDLSLVKISDTVYQLKELDGTTSEFVKQNETFLISTSWTADQNSTTQYTYDSTDSRTLVKRVINAREPGVDVCTTAVPARGCEVMEYEYATATTATSTTFGNVIDQVRAVKVWSWDPVTSSETAVEVTNYAYDNLGRLREVWDPRATTPLKTTYDYDAAGRVTKIGTAGQLPWNFDYGTIAGDSNAGRLLKVRRAALVAGTKSTLDGEVATTVVYGVPLTKTTGGPHNLDATTASTWGQKDFATDATAIFSPESVPTVNLANSTVPGTAGYGEANITYLNASGQTVNTAVPGNFIDSQSYDEFGNVVWSLEATNRDLALGLLPDTADRVAKLNLPADSAGRAALLSTVSMYSPDGLDLLETYGPVVKVALERPLADPKSILPTLAPGALVVARGHTTYVYDEGKPDGATYHLATTERAGGAVAGYPDADVREVHTGYAPVAGGASGWVLKKDTSTTTDAGTAYTVYDTSGRVLKSWGIGSTGTDARATETLYYTAGAHPSDVACGNRPEWAGAPCVTRAVGAVIGHDPLRATTNLPVKRVEEYSRFGDPSKVSETSNGYTRQTITVYNTADRITSVAITTNDGSIAQEPVLTEYDTATGNVWKTTAGTAVITREYDQLGRVVTYTDADGGVTQSQYDRYGKATRVSDNTGWTTYTYDRNLEPRGMLTSLTDSVAGTFNAKYSPDGQLVEVKYPGGITRKDTLDANFQPESRRYSRDSDGTTIYSESVVENTAGQWVNHTYTGGAKTYGYDTLGRLTSTNQTTGSICDKRTYAYDTRTNRTSKKLYANCQAEAATTEEIHTYDTADRIMDAGYIHDAFGRITTTPGGPTNTYYANDLVAQQVLGTTKQNWTLDPSHRFRGFTTSTLVGGTWTNASSKLNHYGDDSDEPRWIVENSSGTLTRNVSGPDTDLVATTSATGDIRLQLTNLHGDVAMTIDTALTSPEVYSYDEFGVPQTGSSDRRYGWLGGKQRSGDALGDIILMGVRLYSPELGRFLQVDPIPGANSNAYDYCSGDGVNCTDLDGKWGWGSIKKALNTVAVVASYASMIPGPIGTIAGVVSAVAYVATGNWKAAAWAAAGALAATVGAGAAVKGAQLAVKGVKAARAVKVAAAARKAQRAASCGNSFTPDTPVRLANGQYLAIADIAVGDWVLAVDPETGIETAKPVLDIIVGQGTKHLVGLDLDGDTSDLLTATANHPIWVVGKGWTTAENVKAGDVVAGPSGSRATVVSVVDHGLVADQRVFNLNIGDIHTYVVNADGEDVVVHNAACKGGVYVLVGESGRVYRSGHTSNLTKRMNRHKNQYPGLTMKVVYHSNNYKTRRGLEEMVQRRYTPLLDKERAINRFKKKWKRAEYLKSARGYLRRGGRD
ncbi:discoidin domain-containing protein [Dactylosporangium sp. CA-233914]|uniref:discoidin domain-containing protein n=1 Tax=Dactylosporangium sp. CA-233914 TaxID=3239934 RepID=UPI003D920D58